MITPKNYLKIDGWMDFEDLYDKVFSNLPDNSHIIEIGCWNGRSACYMAELIKDNKKNVKFDCIDIWKLECDYVNSFNGTIVDLFCNNLREAGVLKEINVLQISTFEAHKLYSDKSLNFIFIDGDHTYEHVSVEFPIWIEKIKSGGYFCGHDYSKDWPGVIKAVNELVETNRDRIDLFQILGTSFLIKLK